MPCKGLTDWPRDFVTDLAMDLGFFIRSDKRIWDFMKNPTDGHHQKGRVAMRSLFQKAVSASAHCIQIDSAVWSGLIKSPFKNISSLRIRWFRNCNFKIFASQSKLRSHVQDGLTSLRIAIDIALNKQQFAYLNPRTCQIPGHFQGGGNQLRTNKQKPSARRPAIGNRLQRSTEQEHTNRGFAHPLG